MSKKQFSPFNPCSGFCEFSCCCPCRCPPSFHLLQRTMVLLAAAPGHLPSRPLLRCVPPLQARNWRWFLKNGGGEFLEQISSRLDRECRRRSSRAPRAFVAGTSTIKTINITMVIHCNKYSNIISKILIRLLMSLKTLLLFLLEIPKRTETWNFPPLITCYALYYIYKILLFK